MRRFHELNRQNGLRASHPATERGRIAWPGLLILLVSLGATLYGIMLFYQSSPAPGARNVSSVPAEIVARGAGNEVKVKTQLLEARQRAEEEVAEQPENAHVLMMLGEIDAALSRKEEALREGQRAVTLPPKKSPEIRAALAVRLAGIYAQVETPERACEELEKVKQLPGGLTRESLQLDAVWNKLRGQPCFEKIVASLAPRG